MTFFFKNILPFGSRSSNIRAIRLHCTRIKIIHSTMVIISMCTCLYGAAIYEKP